MARHKQLCAECRPPTSSFESGLGSHNSRASRYDAGRTSAPEAPATIRRSLIRVTPEGSTPRCSFVSVGRRSARSRTSAWSARGSAAAWRTTVLSSGVSKYPSVSAPSASAASHRTARQRHRERRAPRAPTGRRHWRPPWPRWRDGVACGYSGRVERVGGVTPDRRPCSGLNPGHCRERGLLSARRRSTHTGNRQEVACWAAEIEDIRPSARLEGCTALERVAAILVNEPQARWTGHRIPVSDPGTFGLTHFAGSAAQATRKLLILKRRDGREAEGARLEIDCCCAC